MQYCEHGGAGTEIKVLVDKLKKGGIDDVKIRFLTKEGGFGNSVIHELEDGNYDTVVITERMWEHINGKKVPSHTKVITVSNPL